jgi:hypothetical protein
MTHHTQDFPISCEHCGALINRGAVICEDCFHEDSPDGFMRDIPNWCRLRTCNYECRKCRMTKREADDER